MMAISIKAFKRAISYKRFIPYKRETNDNYRAIDLYDWNKIVSASFYCLLQDLEITLRVSIDRKLTKAYDNKHWYNDDRVNLNYKAEDLIILAKRKIADKNEIEIGKSDNIPDNLRHNLLSELNFGFWTGLFGTGNEKNKSSISYNYDETLWRKGNLSSLFPKEMKRGAIYSLIFELNELRNMIAHHEAIFYRELEKDYMDILTLLGWLSPQMRDHAVSTTRIPYLLENRGIIKSLNNTNECYAEYLVRCRYKTKYEALDAIRKLYLSICEDEDIELQRVNLFHSNFGLLPVQNFENPQKWGIICLNKKYTNKFRNKIRDDWP